MLLIPWSNDVMMLLGMTWQPRLVQRLHHAAEHGAVVVVEDPRTLCRLNVLVWHLQRRVHGLSDAGLGQRQ